MSLTGNISNPQKLEGNLRIKHGADGISPIIEVTEKEDMATLTITDANGTKTTNLDVATKATAIVNTVRGKTIAIDDASNSHLRGLRVFGKSTQNGTPTPTAPVDIVSIKNATVGILKKNLLENTLSYNTANGVKITLNEDGSVIADGVSASNSILPCGEIKAKAGNIYKLSGCPAGGSNTTYRLDLRVNNNTEILATDFGEGATYAPTEDVLLTVCIRLHGENTTFSNVKFYPMVCLSDYDNKYEEFSKQTVAIPHTLHGIPVASGGNYTVNGQQYICDEIDLERGVHVQRIKKFDLASVSVWSQNDGWANKNAFFIGGILSDAVQVAGYFTKANIMCNRLGISTPNDISNTAVNVVAQGAGGGLYVSVEGITTPSDLKNYFAENKTYIYYVLAGPIETPLTAEEIEAYRSLHTNYPNTTVLNDAGAVMEVSYNADTKLFIMQNGGLSARIGEVVLNANKWVGSGNLYSQVVSIDGATANSQVDLTPSVEQLAVFYEKDLAFVTENEDGVVTVHAIGQKPQNDYTIQVTITEVAYE